MEEESKQLLFDHPFSLGNVRLHPKLEVDTPSWTRACTSIMEISADSWFTESDSLWPGQAFSLQIEKILYRGNSKFQDILVFKRLDLSTISLCTATFVANSRIK